MTHTQKAENLLALTQKALQSAQKADWDAAQQLEELRQQAARDLFSTPVPDDEVPTVRECVEKVFEFNRDLVRLGRSERQAVVTAMNKLRKGTAARQAYQVR
mgnify:CR=1 FL=1